MSRIFLAALLSAWLAFAQSGPDNEVLQRALKLHQSGDYSGAITAYEQFLKAHPDAAGVRSNLGAALAHEGRFEDAIREYRLALEAQPAGTPAASKVRLNLALAYFKTAQLSKAAAELAQVRAADPSNQQAALLLATCYLRMGQNKKVIELLDPAWQQISASTDRTGLAVAYLLGAALIRDNQVDRGQVIIDRILKNGDSAEAHLLMGTAKFAAKDFAGARTDLARAVELNPKLPEAQSYLGLVLLRTGDSAGAEKAFRNELALDANDFNANLELGGILRQDRRYQESRPLIERALLLRPGDYGARYQLASIDLAEDRLLEAQARLESLIKDAPNFTEAHVSLATVYYREKRKQDGDREREAVRRLNAELQAKQPGAQPQPPQKAPAAQE
ncbi:MAG TPA: tetratricopeptide repeat protein [Bryobacteraceae bacterium]|nr:tetratricopeptide repeat protein [Bryobacteraceae bacterium]